jgi:hypothetical protein
MRTIMPAGIGERRLNLPRSRARHRVPILYASRCCRLNTLNRIAKFIVVVAQLLAAIAICSAGVQRQPIRIHLEPVEDGGGGKQGAQLQKEVRS